MPLKVPDIAIPSAVATPVLRLRRKWGHAEQRSNCQGPTNNRFHGIPFFNVFQTNCAQVHTKLSTPPRAYSLTWQPIFTWTSRTSNSSTTVAFDTAAMKIKYCPIEGGNFGDTLNTMVWDRLFPDLTQRKEAILVYGIGTLLDGRHDRSLKKIVLGSGLGEANAALRDPNWDFRWVRGPLSAQGFGLSSDLALGDPAVLWPELQKGCGGTANGPIGLIPHYRTWDSFDWITVAANAGMVAINPRQSPNDVIAQTRACSRILAESLHGAICADAMAIPWAPCILAHRFNTFKWLDWLATINRPFSPLVADRPLVRSVSKPKAMANRLARLVHYKAHTRHPALRATACATPTDAQRVSEALARYARDDSNFACSRPTDVDRQRQRMLAACGSFATEYGLAFTP